MSHAVTPLVRWIDGGAKIPGCGWAPANAVGFRVSMEIRWINPIMPVAWLIQTPPT
jgi:hypothetical protein